MGPDSCSPGARRSAGTPHPARMLLAAVLVSVAFAPAASGKALLGEPVVDRPSDGNDFSWCPAEALPFSGEFTADGPEVTFEIRVANQTGPGWRAEHIDNFIVVPLADYLAHTQLPDSAFAAAVHCVDSTESYFHFDEVPPGNIVFLDQFDGAPDPRWVLTGGAYFDAATSAPAALVSPVDDAGGSLGLGEFSNPATLVTTAITLDGFVAGETYVVTLWEYAAFPLGTDLTITVYGTEFFAEQVLSASSQGSYGAAWADRDGDGDDDLYVCDYGAVGNEQFRNDGGSFAPVPTPALAIIDDNKSSTWADYDNDGDLDVYVSSFLAANHLVRNDGGGNFSDVTTSPLNDADPGTAVAWVDFDVDGDVDLFLANALTSNRLFRNDAGTFLDVTPAVFAGTDNTRAASWADADNDGDPDVFLVSGNASNLLIRNDGAGNFADVTTSSLAGVGGGTGATWVDFDNNGLLDLFVTNFQQPNRMFRSTGGLGFVEISAAVGLADEGADSEGAWADYDNDGDPDLYLARSLSQGNTLYRNDNGIFSVHDTGTVEDDASSQGAAWGDGDADGDLDLFVTNAAENSFFRNETGNLNHWLHVHLIGTASNASAIGARVRIVNGTKVQMREVNAGSGRESQNSLDAAFGLGQETSVDSVVVNWPSGFVTKLGAILADQRITIVEGGAITATPETRPGNAFALHAVAPNPFHSGTDVRFALPAPAAVELRVYDVSGREVRTLVDGTRGRGEHHVRWDGRTTDGLPASPGIYFFELRSGQEHRTRKGVRVSP